MGLSRPVLRARAPLRISFAGGGTDVAPFPEREGGAVLSATISNYVYATLRPREDGRITVQSLDFGMSIGFGVDDAVVYDGRLDLPKAAIKRVREHHHARASTGFDLFIHTNAPPGSGLGSSSAVVVVVADLVATHLGLDLSPYELAAMAFTLERNDLGIAGGLQDQYSAAFGGFNYLEFGADGVVINPLRVPDGVVHELEHNMLLCYTGHTRASDHIIEDQVHRYESGDSDALAGLRAQRRLAREMKNLLLTGQVAEFGLALGDAWKHKRQISDRISTPLIDEAMEVAHRSGALGGKVTGAGGGGHLIFVCEFERRHLVAEALLGMGLTVSEFTFSSSGVTTWKGQDARER